MRRDIPTGFGVFRSLRRYFACVLCIVAAMHLGQATSYADESARAEFDSAYEAVLQDPENYTHVWRFVLAAKRIGDYEAAIGVLEPILLVDANQQLIRSEVGLLYYRMGAYDAAKSHLQIALDSGELSPKREAVVATTLAQAKRQTRQNKIGGAVTTGFRYQSNPTFVSDSDTVTFQDTQLQLAGVPTADGDGNFFLSSWLRHQYDLNRQNEAAFDTNATLYFTQQFDETETDVLSFAIEPGFAVKPLRRQAPWLKVRPHLYGNVLTIGDERYALSYGGGLDVITDITDRIRTEFSYQRRQKDFRATPERPFAELLDGAENHYQVRALILLPKRFSLNLRGLGIQTVTDDEIRDNWLWAVSGQVNYRYRPQFGWGQAQWRAWLRVVGEFRNFDNPDPVLSATEEREDQRITVAVGNSANLYKSLDLNFEYLVQNQESEFEQFEFINHSGIVSLTYRY